MGDKGDFRVKDIHGVKDTHGMKGISGMKHTRGVKDICGIKDICRVKHIHGVKDIHRVNNICEVSSGNGEHTQSKELPWSEGYVWGMKDIPWRNEGHSMGWQWADVLEHHLSRVPPRRSCTGGTWGQVTVGWGWILG